MKDGLQELFAYTSLLFFICYRFSFRDLYIPGFVQPWTAAIGISDDNRWYKENVPFPPFVEAIIMEVTIELLREAGIRLPSPIGQTVGLVGGVIIGQAAVQANIVSSLMVIIVSITTITSFTVPQYSFGLAFRH